MKPLDLFDDNRCHERLVMELNWTSTTHVPLALWKMMKVIIFNCFRLSQVHRVKFDLWAKKRLFVTFCWYFGMLSVVLPFVWSNSRNFWHLKHLRGSVRWFCWRRRRMFEEWRPRNNLFFRRRIWLLLLRAKELPRKQGWHLFHPQLRVPATSRIHSFNWLLLSKLNEISSEKVTYIT